MDGEIVGLSHIALRGKVPLDKCGGIPNLKHSTAIIFSNTKFETFRLLIVPNIGYWLSLLKTGSNEGEY